MYIQVHLIQQLSDRMRFKLKSVEDNGLN
jgi:hypothetical protein